jgi:hypothetical protein
MKFFRSLILCFFMLSVIHGSAQRDFEGEERHYAGGSLGLQFGNVINLSISPHYGYFLTKRLSVGLGFTYQYYDNASSRLSLHIYGGSAFARFDIIDQLYLHAEYEMLTYKTDLFSPVRDMEQIFSENALLGAGYRQFISSFTKSNAYIMLLYNFNETQYTPYMNPVIRMGVEFFF